MKNKIFYGKSLLETFVSAIWIILSKQLIDPIF